MQYCPCCSGVGHGRMNCFIFFPCDLRMKGRAVRFERFRRFATGVCHDIKIARLI